MFFKILLGSILTFVVAVCVHMSFSSDSTPLSPTSRGKMEQAQVTQQLTPPSQTNLGCKSYITTSSGKICVHSSNVPEINNEEQEKTAIQYDIENPKAILNDSGEIKIEPGTIFIPFSTKNCGWFCK